MTKAIYAIFLIFVLASCATTQKSASIPSITGEWDFIVTGTPEGDFTGVMVVTQGVDAYTGKLLSNGNELEINSFKYDGTTKKVTGEVPYGGTSVAFDAALNGDEVAGFMSASGMDFPFKAVRKK